MSLEDNFVLIFFYALVVFFFYSALVVEVLTWLKRENQIEF